MQPSKTTLVYIGTYTNTTSKGIYVSRLDLAQGTLTAPVLAAESDNPSFLAVHPTRDWLYAVNEIGTYEGKPSGSVSAFAINRDTGALTPINRQSSVGGGPAHLTVDHGGKNVLVANYGGGSVAVLPVGADGALKPASAFVQHTGSSVNPTRQKGPHAHSVIVDKSDRFAYVADLGLDKIMICLKGSGITWLGMFVFGQRLGSAMGRSLRLSLGPLRVSRRFQGTGRENQHSRTGAGGRLARG